MLFARALLATSVAMWVGPSRLEAAEVRWHADAVAGHFVTGWQEREISFGAGVGASAELGLTPRFGVEGRLVGATFAAGASPTDPSIRATHGNGLLLAGLGVRWLPFADLRGAWLGAAAGYVRTGGRDRFGFDVRLGWDFRIGARLRLGPELGWLQVIESDANALRPGDARLVTLGIAGSFDEGLPAPPPPPVTPKPPETHAAEPAPPRCDPKRVIDPRLGDHDGCRDPLAPAPLSLPDRCPDEPEDYVGASDADGCPLGEAEVKVVGDQIVLNDRVYFDFGYARVKHRSWPLLQSLAKLILAHPEYVLVRIHGHTDEIGDDGFNQKLSEERAAAVKKKLVDFGVPASRLAAKGFGKTQPRRTGGTVDDRQENRRVEFIIERQVKVGAP